MTEYLKEDIDNDLKLLKKQIEIPKKDGVNLLKKHNGDISKCVLDLYEYKDEKNPYEDRDENDPHKKLYELRKILDIKDAFFTKMMENKSNDEK